MDDRLAGVFQSALKSPFERVKEAITGRIAVKEPPKKKRGPWRLLILLGLLAGAFAALIVLVLAYAGHRAEQNLESAARGDDLSDSDGMAGAGGNNGGADHAT